MGVSSNRVCLEGWILVLGWVGVLWVRLYEIQACIDNEFRDKPARVFPEPAFIKILSFNGDTINWKEVYVKCAYSADRA